MGLIIHDDAIKVSIGHDRRGKITSGAGSKSAPKSLNYFNVRQFDEILYHYGEKPDKLILYFPSNTLEHFLTYRFVQWGSNGQTKRVCDKKTFFVRYDQEREREKGVVTEYPGDYYRAGKTYDCEHGRCGCRVDFRLIAFIANPKTGALINLLPYMFRSTSAISADFILTQLKFHAGHYLGLNWLIWVEEVKNGLKKYPIWKIEPGRYRNPMLAGDIAGIPLELPDNGNGVKLLTDFTPSGKNGSNPSTDLANGEGKQALGTEITIEDILLPKKPDTPLKTPVLTKSTNSVDDDTNPIIQAITLIYGCDMAGEMPALYENLKRDYAGLEKEDREVIHALYTERKTQLQNHKNNKFTDISVYGPLAGEQVRTHLISCIEKIESAPNLKVYWVGLKPREIFRRLPEPLKVNLEEFYMIQLDSVVPF